MGGTQLSICVWKDLGLKNSGEVRPVNQAKIGGGMVFVCRNQKTKERLKEEREKTCNSGKRKRDLRLKVLLFEGVAYVRVYALKSNLLTCHK